MLNTAETASSILARWLELTNTAAVWSGGQLKLVRYGDTAVTGNGATWTPAMTPVYDLGDDNSDCIPFRHAIVVGWLRYYAR